MLCSRQATIPPVLRSFWAGATMLACAFTACGAAGCAEPRSERSAAASADSASAPEPPGGAPVAFTEVTADAGLGAFRHVNGAAGQKWFPETMGAGGGFVDYNGDGWLDVVLVSGGTWEGEQPPALRLYRNEGVSESRSGSEGAPGFTDVTAEAGLTGTHAYGMGVVAADYDNDGDQDLYLTALRENKLFRNEGDGTFTEVSLQAGVAGPARWSTAAVFFDADRDGHLDLYVGGYVNWSPEKDLFCSVDGETKAYCTPEQYEGAPGRFYHNNGDGTFTDRTEKAGLAPAPGQTLGAATLDYNDDGWPDLIVANDQERNLLYENDGDGTFTEKGMASGIAFDEHGKARAGMGVDVGAVDSTGRETIFVGNFSGEMVGMFRYAGRGLFVNRAARSKVGYPSLPTLTFGLFLFDANLDRSLDLFLANGHVQAEIAEARGAIDYRQPPQLFLGGRHGGTFERYRPGEESPLTEPMVARGAAHGDYDGDGDLDVLLTENDGPAHLWRNDVRERAREGRASYLRVAFRGRESNRDGVGAEVVGIADSEHMRSRVHTGASYLSQSALAVTFGLGGAERVDTLRVEWPSGQVDEHVGVEANRAVRVVEGAGELGTPSKQELVARR